MAWRHERRAGILCCLFAGRELASRTPEMGRRSCVLGAAAEVVENEVPSRVGCSGDVGDPELIGLAACEVPLDSARSRVLVRRVIGRGVAG